MAHGAFRLVLMLALDSAHSCFIVFEDREETKISCL